ncbi:MAG: epoxyqueuosine reductase QueH [Clostridia bacterium]|nr:epoxyqueuosine reductase QueH [Clostridia bacterium]
MNRRNYNREMEEILTNTGDKTLLLHSCCAPCSSHCLTVLAGKIHTTVLYYNPNIERGEYEKRKEEQKRFLRETKLADFLDCDHEEEAYYDAVRGHEGDKEGGARCYLCYRLRLEKTARLAKERGFDFFGTTLTVSPLKNAEWLNEIGFSLEREIGVRFLPSDFKKKGGYQDSIRLSKEYGLYRQNYCGCVFSRRETTGNESAD